MGLFRSEPFVDRLRCDPERFTDPSPRHPSGVRGLDVVGGETVERVSKIRRQAASLQFANPRFGDSDPVLFGDSFESTCCLFEQFGADLRRGG